MIDLALPDTWVFVRLGDVATIVGGGTPSRGISTYFGGDILWATPTDVTALESLWIDNTAERITEDGLRSSSAKLLPVGTVLMTSRATIGVTAISNRPICTNQGFANFICDEKTLLNEYLANWLPFVKDKLIQLASGSTFKEISKSTLAKLELPLPSLSEQHRIVAILRQADELRRLRRQANKRAQDLLPALFDEMFGDPLKNDKKWAIRPIRRMGKVTTGNTPPRNNPKNYGDHIEWVKSDNLDSPIGYVTPSKEMLSQEGAKRARIAPQGSTLVTCIAGSPESIGKAALTRKTVAFNQQINAVTPFDDVNPHFLYSVIKLSKLAIQALSTKGMKGIVNKTKLEGVSLIYPPKELQDQFEIRAVEAVGLQTKQLESHQRLEALFQSLLTQAFSGELTEGWRDAYAEELKREAEEAKKRLDEKKKPLEIQVETEDGLQLNRTLASLGSVAAEIVKTLKSPEFKNILWPILSSTFTAFAEKLRPFTQKSAQALNEGLVQQISSLPDSTIKEILAVSAAPIIQAWKQAANPYYAAFTTKLSQVAQIDLEQPVIRADIQAIILDSLDDLPRYWTPQDLAIDWRFNHLSRNAIQEAVEMLVVLGQLRPAIVRDESGVIPAFTRVTPSDEIKLLDEIRI